MVAVEAGCGAGNDDPSTMALHDISLIQYLHHDKRPAFVLDFHKQTLGIDQQLSPAFINPALRDNESLLRLISGCSSIDSSPDESEHRVFFDWTKSSGQGVVDSNIHFAGFDWSCTTLAKRWKIIVADTARERCESCRGHKSTPAVEMLSTSVVDAHLSNNFATRKSANDHSQANASSTSANGKNSTSHTRAPYFYAEEPRKSHVDKNPRDVEGDHSPEVVVDTTNSESSEPSMSSAWSDILIARRNADLLAKISAFDAMGLCVSDMSGDVVFANDAWYKICQLPHGPTSAAAWMSIFEEQEALRVAEIWQDILIKQEVVQFEVRLKWRWKPPVPSGIDLGPADFPVWFRSGLIQMSPQLVRRRLSAVC